MPPEIRRLVRSDLEFAHSLSRGVGWNQTRRDWERFLELAPGGCFLAESGGQPAGTATTTAYGTELAWIGMVLVEPTFRRLDATPEGRPLYEGLGFAVEWDLRRWVRDEAAEPEGACPSPPEPEEAPLPASSLALDLAVFGADRSLLLESLRSGSDDALFLPDGSFGFRRAGERAHYLGPVTAATSASGLALAERLVSRCPRDRPLFWDLPESNEAATALAVRLGFHPVRLLTRMRLGENAALQDPSRIFGLAEPGLG
jgi:hypothetical protein